MEEVRKCLKCGYICCTNDGDDSIHTMGNCNGKMVKTPLSGEEFLTMGLAMQNILQNNEEYIKFFDSMIELKENNIAEYAMKMSQFSTQVQQKKASMGVGNTVLRCPSCRSTQVRKIDVVERAGSVAIFGLFSKKINKSFKCRSCGYTW